MTVKTFLLACFLHILLFIGLAIPEIARADLDKAIAYAEAGEKDKAYEELLCVVEQVKRFLELEEPAWNELICKNKRDSWKVV